MSWFEKIENKISITTGDGAIYTPNYFVKKRGIEYNASIFEFPNVKGSLVDKGMAKGARHTFSLIFQSEDHLDVVKRFETSNDDTRPWKVSHPLYGLMTMQCLSLEQDPSALSSSTLIAEVIETITNEYPRVTKSDKEEILFLVNKLVRDLPTSIETNVDFDTEGLASVSSNTDKIYSLGSKSITFGTEANEYFDRFTELNSAILSKLSSASRIAEAMISFYNYPSLFTTSIVPRITLLRNQLTSIYGAISVLSSPNEKSIFELTGSSLLVAAAGAAVNNVESDFDTSTDALNVIDMMVDIFNIFKDGISEMQTIDGDSEDSYVPNYDNLNAVSELMYSVTATLLNVALNSKKERVIYLSAPSNAVLLAHRFYGSGDDDTNIELFMRQNKIGLSEVLELPVNRKIYYYI